MSMSWAIGFVTLERPVLAQRFVRSARLMFPDVPIYVAEQSRRLGPMAEFYEAERVTVVRMPFDAGLSASRNALVEAMNVDYLALCDDDFILGPATSFPSAISVLEQDEELGVVGGMLHDYDGVTERIRNWEMFFDHDERNQRFTATPIYNHPPVVRQINGKTVYVCDAVLNFAVLRKAMFSRKIRWEESIKVNGEHEDFYLNLKKHSPYRVAYLPTMAALHLKVQQPAFYTKLRSREDGRHGFIRKWNLVSHLEIGVGGRPLDGAPVRSWFVGGKDGADNTAYSSPLAEGDSLDASAGISHSQLYSAMEREEACQTLATAEATSLLDWIGPHERFSLSIPAGRFLFCYQPAVDNEGDMLLWGRDMHPPGNSAAEQNGAGVILRWFSSGGDVLVWESEVHAIRCSEDRYWQPLAVRVPVWPRGTAYLRFEVVSACEKRTPLAAGFVFTDSSAVEPPGACESHGVLALCRATAETARVESAHKPLLELLASAPRVEIDVVRNAGQPWVTMDVSSLDFLGISHDSAAESPLVLASGLTRARVALAPLALPLDLVMDPEKVLFAGEADPDAEQLFIIVPRLVDVMPDGESAVPADSAFADPAPGIDDIDALLAAPIDVYEKTDMLS